MKKEAIIKLFHENKEFLDTWIKENCNADDKPTTYIENYYKNNNDTPFLKINNWFIGIDTKYSMICHMELQELQKWFSYYDITIVVKENKLQLRIGE